jgi:hypothetical protein
MVQQEGVDQSWRLLSHHASPLPRALQGLDLNVGGATVSAALMEVTGTSRTTLRALYKQHGDLGDVAQVSSDWETLV